MKLIKTDVLVYDVKNNDEDLYDNNTGINYLMNEFLEDEGITKSRLIDIKINTHLLDPRLQLTRVIVTFIYESQKESDDVQDDAK